MTNQPSESSADAVPALLRTALQAYQRGDHVAARALVRRLASHHPDDPRVWMTLARIAETRQEQRQALERVLVFDPANQAALRGLARFDDLNSRTAAAPPRSRPAVEQIAEVPEEEVAEEPTDEGTEIRWPLYVVIGVAVLVVLVAYLLLRPSGEPASGPPTPALSGMVGDVATEVSASPTPPLLSPGAGEADASPTSGAGPPAPTLPSALGSADRATETVPAAPSVVSSTAVISTVTAPAPTVTEPPPGPTVAAQLLTGQLVTVGPWTASLLSPNHAKMLDGSIGALQPHGRFVLALMSVANSGADPQPVPKNLVTLVDSQGRRYQPIPAASTTYLQTYGRAQAGDFSMEQPIPGGARMWSVPLIFDVPPGVQSLTLQVGDASPGWSVEVSPPSVQAGG